MLENLWINKKWAFVDGALCATLVIGIAAYNRIKSRPSQEDVETEKIQAYMQGILDGRNTYKSDVARFIDHERYERIIGKPFMD